MLSIIANILPIPLMEDDLGTATLFDQILQVLTAEWRISAEEGVGDDSQGPHVDRLSVALLEHDFWGGVAEGTGHGGEDFIFGVKHLGDTEVGEHEVRLWVGGEVEEILWLEIYETISII